MDKDAMRLECLKVAATKMVGVNEIVAAAQKFVDFIYDPKIPADNAKSASVTVGKDDNSARARV